MDFIYARHSHYMLISLLLLLRKGPEIWQGKNKFQQMPSIIFFIICTGGPCLSWFLLTRISLQNGFGLGTRKLASTLAIK